MNILDSVLIAIVNKFIEEQPISRMTRMFKNGDILLKNMGLFRNIEKTSSILAITPNEEDPTKVNAVIRIYKGDILGATFADALQGIKNSEFLPIAYKGENHMVNVAYDPVSLWFELSSELFTEMINTAKQRSME